MKYYRVECRYLDTGPLLFANDTILEKIVGKQLCGLNRGPRHRDVEWIFTNKTKAEGTLRKLKTQTKVKLISVEIHTDVEDEEKLQFPYLGHV